jgi:hypothetical protein
MAARPTSTAFNPGDLRMTPAMEAGLSGQVQ